MSSEEEERVRNEKPPPPLCAVHQWREDASDDYDVEMSKQTIIVVVVQMHAFMYNHIVTCISIHACVYVK